MLKIMIRIVDAEIDQAGNKAIKEAILSQVVKLTETAFTSNLAGQKLVFDKTVYSNKQICAEVYLKSTDAEKSEE